MAPVAAVGPVSFTAPAGQQLTLLGPSGCGKTTTLRAIAGLEQPSAGAIRIGGQGRSIPRPQGINVPAEKRGLSMVFQSYAIWPHMTVFENVAYGLRVRRKSRSEIEEKVGRRSIWCRWASYAERPASQLSGGQQQRVALARACAFSPIGAAVRRAALQPRRQAARATCGSSCASCSTGSASRRST